MRRHHGLGSIHAAGRIFLIGSSAAVIASISWLGFIFESRSLGVPAASEIGIVRAVGLDPSRPLLLSDRTAEAVRSELHQRRADAVRVSVFARAGLNINSPAGTTLRVTVIGAGPQFFDVLPLSVHSGERRVFLDRTGCGVVASTRLIERLVGSSDLKQHVEVSVGGHMCSVTGAIERGAEFPDHGVDMWVPLELLRLMQPRLFAEGYRSFGLIVRPVALIAELRNQLSVALLRFDEGDSAVHISTLPEVVYGETVTELMSLCRTAALGILAFSIAALLCAGHAAAARKTKDFSVRMILGAGPYAALRPLLWPAPVIEALGATIVGGSLFVVLTSQVRSHLMLRPESAVDASLALSIFVLVGVAAFLVASRLVGTVVSALFTLKSQALVDVRSADSPLRLVDRIAFAATAALAVCVTIIAMFAGGNLVKRYQSDLKLDWRRLVIAELPPRAGGAYALLDDIRRLTAGLPEITAFGLLSHLPMDEAPPPVSISYAGKRLLNGDDDRWAMAPRVYQFAGDALAAMGLSPAFRDSRWHALPAALPSCFWSARAQSVIGEQTSLNAQLDFPGPMFRGHSKIRYSCRLEGVVPDLPYLATSDDPHPQVAMQFRNTVAQARYAVFRVETSASRARARIESRLTSLSPVRVWSGRSLFETFTAAEHIWLIFAGVVCTWAFGSALLILASLGIERAQHSQVKIAVVLALGGSYGRAAILSCRPLLMPATVAIVVGVLSSIVLLRQYFNTQLSDPLTWLLLAMPVALVTLCGLSVGFLAWRAATILSEPLDLLRR